LRSCGFGGAEVRLVAVLGYSGRPRDRLHAVCEARLRHAEAIEGDAFLLSGEAELMRRAWKGGDVLIDAAARNTRDNATGVAAVARRLRADEVVVVTSRWHAFRARTLVRVALRDASVSVESSSPPGRRPVGLLARELACLALLPLHARGLARRSEPRD
jgi:uncharacterized SAM-binding protein YcdF (DUF218 family)